MKFTLSTIALLGVIYALYLHNPSLEDYNWESMDIPLTVGYLTSGKDHSQVLENYKQQDGVAAHGYPRGRFRFNHMALACPVQCVSYIPFIKLFGVSNKAIAWYAMFYCVIAWVLTAYIAYLLFGKWEALLSVFFLATSLSWLIHTKAAVISVMPSVCLFLGLVIAVIRYERDHFLYEDDARWLLLMGVLLGLCFLTGWIVFPFACLFLALNWKSLIGNYRWIIPTSIITIGLFTQFYSIFYKLSWYENIQAVWDAYTYRFFQGQNPVVPLALWEKPLVTINQLFWDMKATDHPDKYAEGCAAISPIFTGFFLYGLWTHRQKVLNYWLISVFLVLVTVYAFANRYAMIALPGMAIIVAWGATRFFKWCYFKESYNDLNPVHTRKSIMFASTIMLMLLVPFYTHLQYHQFTREGPENFERDRMRGHTALYSWIKSNYSPKDTVLVLGDPITQSPFASMFHCFDDPYQFVVVPNSGTVNNAKNVILILSAQKNAMEGIKPDFTYTYEKTRPLIYAYVLKAERLGN